MNYLTKAFPMPDVHDVPESAILGIRDSVLAIVSDGPETLRMWEHRIAALAWRTRN